MFYREALVWKQLKNPFILPFLGVDSEAFPGFMCMVSPWMDHGTIIDYLKGYRDYPVESIVAGLVRLFYHNDPHHHSLIFMPKVLEIAHGIQYLHSLNIVHGDLRGVSLFLMGTGRRH